MAKNRTRAKTKVKSMTKKKAKEVTAVGQLLRELGGLGGGLAGGMLGLGGLGNSAGRQMAGAASKWLGFGDYEVKANTILRPTGTIPMMHANDQSIVVRHREYLGELDGSTGFSLASILPLNPGMAATFPWLATIASRFLEYRIKGLVFHFVPTSGTAISSTSAALGSVMFQTSYRATDSQPNNKIEMLNEYWATEGRPCDEIVHAIECDPKENPFEVHYVRTGKLPDTENLLLYDLGKTFVATNGMQTAGQTIGDLWVTYEVELKKPVVASAVSDPVRAVSITSERPTSLYWFEGDPIYVGNLDIRVNGPNPNKIEIPVGLAGYFYLYAVFDPETSFTACTVDTTPTLVNCITVATSPGGSNVTGTVGATGTINYAYLNCAVFKPDSQSVATIDFTTNTFTGSQQVCTLTVFHRDSPLWT